MFMEGARQVGVSVICVECICQEEGARLPGSILCGVFLFMICGLSRGQAKGSLHARVLQSAKGKDKGARIFKLSQGRRRRTLLGAHIPRNHCKSCEEIAKYQVPLYLSPLLYYMHEAHHIYTFISNWFSPGGVIQGHVDQKYPCSFHVCQSLEQHYFNTKRSLGVLYSLRYGCANIFRQNYMLEHLNGLCNHNRTTKKLLDNLLL